MPVHKDKFIPSVFHPLERLSAENELLGSIYYYTGYWGKYAVRRIDKEFSTTMTPAPQRSFPRPTYIHRRWQVDDALVHGSHHSVSCQPCLAHGGDETINSHNWTSSLRITRKLSHSLPRVQEGMPIEYHAAPPERDSASEWQAPELCVWWSLPSYILYPSYPRYNRTIHTIRVTAVNAYQCLFTSVDSQSDTSNQKQHTRAQVGETPNRLSVIVWG